MNEDVLRAVEKRNELLDILRSIQKRWIGRLQGKGEEEKMLLNWLLETKEGNMLGNRTLYNFSSLF